MSTDRPLLYSIRRLNPFEGVMQIIDSSIAGTSGSATPATTGG